MIRGIHGLLYSSDPDATRKFFREAVKLPGNDIGEGWWIFDLPEGDLGVHPTEDPTEAGKHDVSLYCDDIHNTVADLKSRGVEFTADVEDHGYGLVTYFTAPGGITVQLYEPRYSKPAAAARRRPRATRPSAGTKGAKGAAAKMRASTKRR